MGTHRPRDAGRAAKTFPNFFPKSAKKRLEVFGRGCSFGPKTRPRKGDGSGVEGAQRLPACQRQVATATCLAEAALLHFSFQLRSGRGEKNSWRKIGRRRFRRGGLPPFFSENNVNNSWSPLCLVPSRGSLLHRREEGLGERARESASTVQSKIRAKTDSRKNKTAFQSKIGGDERNVGRGATRPPRGRGPRRSAGSGRARTGP
jgi:hypothetical protein